MQIIVRAALTAALGLTTLLPARAAAALDTPQVSPTAELQEASGAGATPAPEPDVAPVNEEHAADESKLTVPPVKAVSFPNEVPDDSVAQAKPKSRVARSDRRFAVMAVLGWNSLVGFGVAGSYSIIPHLSADLALGLGGIGLKGGVRLRGNLLTSNWTPTLGVGMQFAPGSGGAPIHVAGANGQTTVMQVEQSAFLQALIGLSYQGDRGFSLLIASGYSFLLDKENVRFISGDPQVAALERTLCHGGLVAEVAIGYAF